METQINDFAAYDEEKKQYKLLKTLVASMRSKAQVDAQCVAPAAQSFDEDAKWQEVSGVKKKASDAQRLLREYDELLPNPYIGRIDFPEDSGMGTVYISEDRQQHSVEGFSNIASWTSPIGKFYHDNIGNVYVHGDIKQEIERRREIHIEDSALVQAADTYLRGNDLDSAAISDTFLRNVLKQHAESGEIASILRTVQRNQFALITQDLGKNLIIQGCAGSGKTMILLHRLVYLLQNFRERLHPEDIAVIAPSDFFLDFTSSLSRHLGLEQIQRYTPERFCLHILEKYGKDLSKQKVKVLPERGLPDGYLKQVYSRVFWNSHAKAAEVAVQNTLDSFYAFAEGRDIAVWAEKNEVTLVFEGSTRKDKINGFAKYFTNLLDVQNEHRNVLENYRKKISDAEEKVGYETERLRSVESLNAMLADKHARIRACTERLRKLEKYRDWEDLRTQHVEDFANKKKSAHHALAEAIKEWSKTTRQEGERFEALINLMRCENELHSYMETGRKYICYEQDLKEIEVALQILAREFDPPLSTEKQFTDLARLQEECEAERQMLADEAEELEAERNAFMQNVNEAFSTATVIADLQGKLLYHDTEKKLRELRSIAEAFGDHVYRIVFRDEMRALKNGSKINMSLSITENKNVKERYSLLYRHDLMQYMLCMFHAYGSIKTAKLICVDEAQGLSSAEYKLLIDIAGTGTTWNLLGDVLQANPALPNCTTDWSDVSALGGFTQFALNENYRNTEKITNYCNERYGTKMKALGFPGNLVVSANSWREALDAYRGLSAKDENAVILVVDTEKWEMRGLASKGIRVLSIDEARGTEFQTVIAVVDGMSMSECYMASTRALKNLIIVSLENE